MISKIQLNIGNDEQINNNDLRNLQRALKDNKRSTSLTIKHNHSWLYHNTENIDSLFAATNRWKSLKFFYSDNSTTSRPQELQRLTRLRRCRDLAHLEVLLNCFEENKNLILQNLSKQVKGLNSLKDLSIDTSNCDSSYLIEYHGANYDKNATMLTFRFPKSLSSLKIVFEGGCLHNEMFSKFTKNIHHSSSLEYLHLDVSRLYHDDEPVLENSWSHLFEKTKALKALTLNAYWCSFQSNQGAQEFIKGLQQLKQIKTLNFNFALSAKEGLLEMFFHDLFYDLSSLPNLASLSLNYDHIQSTTDIGLNNKLFLPLQYLTQLQQFRFSCSQAFRFDNVSLKNFTFALQHLQNLNKFHLLLHGSWISDSGVFFLSESLKKLLHIQELYLNFEKCNNLSEKSLEILSKEIFHLNPTSFTLRFGKPKTKSLLQHVTSHWKDQNQFTSFFSALQKFTLLSHLALNFAEFNINTSELKSFSSALKNLKDLTSLSLNLPQFDSENSFEGFISFGLSLKELPKLKSLHMTTSKRAKLRDQEILMIFLSVKECRFLEDLSLSFDCCKLTGESLQHALSGLRNLRALKCIDLAFYSERPFKRKEILLFLEGLTALKKLEKIEFGYPNSFEKKSLTLTPYHHSLRHLTQIDVYEI